MKTSERSGLDLFGYNPNTLVSGFLMYFEFRIKYDSTLIILSNIYNINVIHIMQ